MASIIAVDIGGTKIAAARVSRAGAIGERVEAPTPAGGGEAVLAAIAAAVGRLSGRGVAGVALAVPGQARPDGSVWAPNVRGWRDFPLRRRAAARFHCPVLVADDRQAFIAGEAWRGAARGCRDALLLILGTGVGAGILCGGRIVRGHQGLAGAVGWWRLPEGDVESQLAGPALARAGSRRLARATDARELVRLARQGDARAVRLWDEAGERLGWVLANLVSAFNPEVIVIAGGVSAAGELLLRPARRAMRRSAQPLAARQVRIVRSRLGGDAALIGLAKLFLESTESSE